MIDNDAQQLREYKRQEIVNKAVDEADRIILDASDGTEKMTNGLTAELAIVLLETALIPLTDGCNEGELSEPVHKAFERINSIVVEECRQEVAVVANFVRFQIAQKFVNKAAIPFGSALLRWELENPVQSEETKE